ncbi:histone acetyltransferase 1, partial [Coemansia sp. RSA 1938]
MDSELAAASQWATESNAAVFIRLISGETESGVVQAMDSEEGDEEENEEGEGADVIEFHPEFTYPIYGEHERIFGYKGLSINLNYAAGSLATYFNIKYTKRIEQMESTSTVALKADDIDTPMRQILADSVCATQSEFAQQVVHDTRVFRPSGRKVHEYAGRSSQTEQLRYEIYSSSFNDTESAKYHERMQAFVLFFIEGAQFIDTSDERWHVYTVFERLDMNGQTSYSLVGFSTV